MSKVVYGSGNRDSHLCLIGERPGVSEMKEGRGFVGPAGNELWDRMSQVYLPGRESWWVSNVVKSFSVDPPTPADIKKWTPVLREELRHLKPLLIVTVGAFAARWFLGPDFDIASGHGLLYTTRRSYTVGGVPSYVIPCFHSSAALRLPERYQRPFTSDLQAVADFFKKGLTTHEAVRLDLSWYDCRQSPVASRRLLRRAAGQTIGCDTEGTHESPEAITFAVNNEAYLVGVDQQGVNLARAVLGTCREVVLHYAVHDLRVLWSLGLTIGRFADTMLQSYLLHEFLQGLKPLAYRHLQYQMDDYMDLIRPVDEQLVRTSLEGYYDVASREAAPDRPGKRRDAKAHRPHPVRSGGASGDSRRLKRAATSLKKILTKPAQKSLRQRAEASKFSDLWPLPQAPTWQDIPPEIGGPYACTDAAATLALHRLQKPALLDRRLLRTYRMDLNVLPMLARIEQVGLQVDRPALEALGVAFRAEYESVCDQIEALIGHRLNPKASSDVSDTLFGDGTTEGLGITPTPLTKGGKHYTTQDKYLKAREHEHLLIPLIMEGREIDKLRGSYAERLPKLLDDHDVYHPEWSYTRTTSGRLTETIIVLIPKHSKRGKLIRNCFVARPGNLILAHDLAQIELRVLAHLSGDKALTRIFRQGRDPHTETAHDCLGAPKLKEDQDDSLHRFPAKKVNFGAFMGLSPKGLTEQIRAGGNTTWASGCHGCDDPHSEHLGDCDSVVFFREYFRKYPGIKSYIADRHAEARRFGYVRDLFGRRIDCAGIRSQAFGVVRRTERMAQATPVQASADGISKVWMKRIWDQVICPRTLAGQYCEPWCRVHDDTLIETQRNIAPDVQKYVLSIVPQLLSIPTTADGKSGSRWGDLV